MRLLPTEHLIVPPRQRKEMDAKALSDLQEDIEKNGLLHAIVVREDGRTLVAGERRSKAMSGLHMLSKPFYHDGELVPADHFPIVIVNTDNDQIRQLEIELNENLLREELSWQDRVNAMADLHKLRAAQNEKQTFADTSREVAEKTATKSTPPAIAAEISRAMITADFLDRPEVSNARNEKEAFNAASRIIREQFVSALPTLPSNHSFVEGEAVAELKKLVRQKRQFRCFIMDPPYGVNAQTFKNRTKTKHEYDDSVEYALKLNHKLIELASKLSTDDGHLWLFCDVDHFVGLREFAGSVGWKVFPTPIVWDSGTRGHIPNQKDAIRRNYELILFARKGERGLSHVMDDIIRNLSGGTIEHHAAAKPFKLFELLLRLSCVPGDNVLDPTCGSGTIFHAAAHAKVNAVGIELDAEYAKLSRLALTEASAKK